MRGPQPVMQHPSQPASRRHLFSPGGAARHIWAAYLCLLLCLICPGIVHGYIIINAPMTDTNAAGWVLGGNPASATLTGNGVTDPVGSGWLRITNSSGNQTGFAYNTTPFDLSAGVLIQFDYAAWGGSGADGVSVFLFDAGVSPFNIGAFGGSLGYAQKLPPTVNPAVPGVSGGYVGVGIDEYGNFSNPTEGRYLGPGATPNTVTVRGSVVGFGNGAIGSTSGTTSYPWIATSGNNGSLWINSGTRPDQLSANYRKVIVEITPAPNPTVSAWIQFGYNTAPTPMITSQALPAISSSQQLMVGFGGSTGGSTNYHEVRNLLITSLNTSTAIDLGVTKTPVATGTTTPAITSAIVGNSFQYLITARNYGPNNITATGVGITDTFPANITPGTWTCATSGGATCGAASGSGNLNTTANIPRYGAVTYTVNATLNSMPAGNLLSNTTTLTIPGAVSDYNPANNSSTSTINAYGLPTVTKSFSPATVPVSTNSALTITLTNPNNIAATGVAFTDTFPTNLVNASTTATTVCGGTLTPTNGSPAKLTFTGGTIPANGSCTITTNVLSATAATYTNTLASGAVTTTNIGSNAAAATSTLTVQSAPTVAKSFAVGSMAAGDTTNLTVTITNPNAAPITLTSALTDTFPANMTIATAGNTGTCTGVTATAGDTKFTMASGTSIPAGVCTVIVTVTSSATSGTSTNTIAAGALQTSAGNNPAAATASLTMHAAATLTKAYSATTIAAGSTSTLTFTITNGGGAARPAQSGMAFTDTFPAGLTVTAVSALAGNGCSGTTAFTPTTVTLTNGAITGGAAGTNGPCTFTATVQGNTGGTYVNNSGQFSGVDGGLITSSTTATLNVYAPPTVTKTFSPASIAVGGTSVMTLTLANPGANPGAITTDKVSDTFPAGMTLKDTTFTYSPAACGTVTKISGAASAAGDNNVLLTAASLASGASCQVQMNVTVSSASNFTNTTNAPTATGPVALTGTAASATLNSTQAPTVAKSFAAGTIASGASTSMTVSISNTNAGAISLTGTFTDSFPAGMTIGTAGNTGTCTGVTAAAGDTKFTMASGTSIPTGGCTIIANVTSATAGAAINTIAAGALQTTTGSNAAAASATLTVYAPPTATKSFAPASISYGGSTTMTLTLGNPAANVAAITTAQVDDTFPAGLTLQNTTFTFTPAACGTVTKTSGAASAAGDNNIRFTAASIASGATCQVAVNLISSAATSITNTTNAPAATGPVALTGTAASATLTVADIAPTVAKTFAAGTIASGGTTTMTVTIGNTNAGAIALTSAFTDTFPAGMTIGTAGNTGTCTGVTATAGDNKFTMANGTSIPAGGCTIIVTVTSSTAGAATNTIAAGALQTVAGNNAAASATLNVYAPPTLSKTFGASSIGAGGSTTLTLTLGNPAANVAAITTVDADDTFPAGLTLQNTTFAFTPAACGTVTNTSGAASAAGDTNIRFIAASIAPGATCQVAVNVKSSTAGSITNTTAAPTAAGPVALTGTAASAPLTVTLLSAPTVVKTFNPTQMGTGETSLVTVTLTNPNSIDITGVAFTDTLPTSPGQMTTTSVLTNSCGGTGTISSNKSFSLTGGTIPANGSCFLSVSVTATTLGLYTNTTSTVTSTNAATASAASAQVTVALLGAPSVAKTFSPNQIGINGTSAMTITLTNPNNVAITGAAFIDNYPASLVNTGTPNGAISGTGCSGTVTAAANGTSLVLANGTIPANGSCTATANVTSAASGTYVNSTGAVTTTNASSGTAASGTLNVLQAPTVTKAFAPASILPNGTSVLTVTLTNPNSFTITGAAFTDNYPANLVNTGTPNGAISGTGCSGTVTAANNGTSLVLANGTIPANGSCAVTVNVTSATTGSYTNSTGQITTTNAGTAAAVTGALSVYIPPTITKAFATGNIASSGTTTMTVTIGNTNAGAIALTSALTDTFPAGMTIAAAGNTGICTGVTATAGDNKFTMANGTSIPAGGCTIIVNVTSSTTGAATNTIAVGALQTVAGSNAAAASATLNIYTPPTLTKAFGATNIASGGSTTLALTLGNPAANVAAITTARVDDTFPAGLTLQNTTFTFTPAACGTVTKTSGAASAAGDNNVRFTAASIAPGATCQVVVNVTSSTAGSIANTTNAPTAAGPVALTGAAASATLNVYASPTVTKSFAPASISYGGTATMTITVTNPAANPGNLTGVAISDTYGGTLVNNAVGSVACSGAGSATLTGGANGGTTVGFNAGTIVPGGTCTITQSVTATATVNNSTTAPTATGPVALTGTAAGPVTLTVADIAPTVAKTFAAGTIASGGTTTMTVTIGNTNAGAIALTSAFTDTFPAGMTIGTAGNTGTCTGVTATAGDNKFTMANGTSIPAGGCTIIVTVTSSTAGAATNTIAAGALQTVAGNNAAASATLNVYAPPTAAKSIVSPFNSGATTTMTLTVANPAANPGAITAQLDDPFPAGLILANTAFTFTPAACGTVTRTSGAASAAGDSNVRLTAVGLVANASCQVQLTVTSSTPGTTTNTTNAPAGTAPVATTGTAASAPLTVISVFAISGSVYSDANHNGLMDGSEAGTGQSLFVKLSARSGASCTSPAFAAATADPATGTYTLTAVPAGDYCLILSINATLTDTTPIYPSGWLSTETPTGTRSVTVSSTSLTSQNFGTYNGGRLSGRVFGDTGTGGGTPNNGVQDGGESGLAVVTVKVTDSGGGTVYDTATTNGNGDYTLWIPAAAGSGTLKVVETNPAGYLSTGGSAGNTGGSYSRSTDTTSFTNTVGTVYSGVTFADVPANQFQTDNNQSAVAGAVVFYPHTFIAGSGGSVTFSTAAVASPAISGWSEVIYLDANCNGTVDAGESTVSGPVIVSAGQSVCIVVKEFVPVSAPAGATNQVTVSAVFTYTNASPPMNTTLTRTDMTTVVVITPSLVLTKSVDKASAKPGDTLVYTITYFNSGSNPLSNIVITDNVPAFTQSPVACCVNPSTACLDTPATSFPAAITGCTTLVSSTSAVWTLSGTLAPGASGQVKMSVQIQQ